MNNFENKKYLTQRNSRCKDCIMKCTLQIYFLLGICIWVHSHENNIICWRSYKNKQLVLNQEKGPSS